MIFRRRVNRRARLQITCPTCQAAISPNFNYCPVCGDAIDRTLARRMARDRMLRDRRVARDSRYASISSRDRHRRRRNTFTRTIDSICYWIQVRSRILKKAGIAFAVILIACGGWGFFIEPNLVQETRVVIPIENLPAALEGFTIVQISDTHIQRLGIREKKAIDIVERAKPDVIALTGDFAGGAWGERTDQSAWEAARFVKMLKAKYAVFAVWGDWDYSPVLRSRLQEAGVLPLFNTAETIRVRGSGISFAGLGLNIVDLDSALKSVDPENVKVLLCHEAVPESVYIAAEKGFSLSLVGGEHGGQVCLPIIGPVRASGYYGRSFTSGLHRIQDSMYLYANRGLGMSDYPLRFLCPPEVAVLTLKRK